jgi:hypothetical protein
VILSLPDCLVNLEIPGCLSELAKLCIHIGDLLCKHPSLGINVLQLTLFQMADSFLEGNNCGLQILELSLVYYTQGVESGTQLSLRKHFLGKLALFLNLKLQVRC